MACKNPFAQFSIVKFISYNLRYISATCPFDCGYFIFYTDKGHDEKGGCEAF